MFFQYYECVFMFMFDFVIVIVIVIRIICRFRFLFFENKLSMKIRRAVFFKIRKKKKF